MPAQNILNTNPKLDSVWRVINKVENIVKSTLVKKYVYNSRKNRKKIQVFGVDEKDNIVFREVTHYYKTGVIFKKVYLYFSVIHNEVKVSSSPTSIIRTMNKEIIKATCLDLEGNRFLILNNKSFKEGKYSDF